MDIQKNIKNELLKRQEISIIIEADKNPGFNEMRKKISEEFLKPEENIEVYNVKGKFGRDTFLVKAYVYDSKEDLEKAVQKSKKQRKAEESAAAEEAKKRQEAESASAAKATEEKSEKENTTEEAKAE